MDHGHTIMIMLESSEERGGESGAKYAKGGSKIGFTSPPLVAPLEWGFVLMGNQVYLRFNYIFPTTSQVNIQP